MDKKIRSPILVMLGHVDHGKTSLLDKIRGTAIIKTEPGLITQYISASYVPMDVIKSVCGKLLDTLKIEFEMPGLLCIDSPGHEAFTTLRKRGGAIADIAILVVDINEGFQPQTDESLNFLKQFKTPFVVALTKIDKILGWNPREGSGFLTSLKEQTQRTQDILEEKIYRVIGQLKERGFECERYDRVSDYTKQVSIVPVSSVTGEGIPDLLMVLCGIAQRYLKPRLEVTPGKGKGTVLEVKEFKGLGTTIDVILYDGEIRKGDYLVIGGKEIITARVRALLRPEALKELRIEKNFSSIESVSAAVGVKISAPGLDNVIAGSPLRAVRSEKDLDSTKRDVESEVEEVEIESDIEGVLIKADTLGSLEAMIKSLKGLNIPIRGAQVGDVTKSDIMGIKPLKEPVIFAFGVKTNHEVEKLARDNYVTIFSSDVIYKILEDYQEWVKDRKKRGEERLLETVTRPGRVRVLPGYVFRQKRPAVFGVEVISGTVRTLSPLIKRESKYTEGNVLGEIREIQSKGENVKEAVSGDKVAISMDNVTMGKEIKEGDVLDVFLSESDFENLGKLSRKLRQDEKEVLGELREKGLGNR